MPVPQIEFILESRLREDLERVQADLSILDDFFEGLSTERVGEFKNWFGAESLRVTIGFPRDPNNVPEISIVLGSLKRRDDFVGDVIEADLTVEGNPIGLEDIVGAFYEGSFIIFVTTDNADTTSLLSGLVIDLLEGLTPFLDLGLYEFDFGATDLTPMMDYLPHFLYTRSITVTCTFFIHTGILYRKIKAVNVKMKEPDNDLSDVIESTVATIS